MSYVNAVSLGLLIAMAGIAAGSVWAIVGSIQVGDVASTWGWAAVFVGPSLVAAWCFWRLV
jgi:hypothetical protein